MIMNLFTKSFLIDEDIIKNNTENIAKDINFNLSLENPLKRINDFLDNIKSNRTVSFYFIPFSDKTIFEEILPNYLFCIQLEPCKEYFDSIYNHNELFNDIFEKTFGFENINSNLLNENIVMTINQYFKYKNQFDFEEIESEELLKEIPAEYFINMIGENKIADKKFNNFRLFDIINALTKVWNYLYNTGRDKEKKAKKVLSVFENNSQYRVDELLIKFPEIEKNLKGLFTYYGFDEYNSLITKDLKEYIKLSNTTMGYNSLSIYKFNKFLAEYIQKINYKVPTEVGKYA